ncbi:hypothetical protein OROGR_014112 [Orobanche gracilis]
MDVLLYNFFGSSPLSNQWRVVYEFLKEKDLLDASSPSFPTFSQSKHNILCSELKQLYVAITRTRQRLWICENNEDLSKPMFDYWRRLCLVQVRKIDDSLAEAMQRASSPEEWKSQGIKLFWEKNYEMATWCFEKAGEETWEKRAKASGLAAAADALRGSNPKEARVMLREAAEIFDSIGRANSAAECFCDLGEYERAGNIYLEKCGTSELRKAGECFSLAGNYKIAAEVYSKGNFFDECLSACNKGNYFDLGLQYVEQWKQQASLHKFTEIDKIGQEFCEKSALECYYRKKDSASLMKFVRAFNTLESKRRFLISLECFEELLILEEESGNFYEAAEIAKGLGDIQREFYLLEKAGDFENASSLILSYVLSNSLWLSGSQGWPLKSFPQKEELLTKAMSVSQKLSGNFHSSVCAEANVIMTHEQKNLSQLMQSHSASKQCRTRTGEILSARKLLDAHFEVHTAKYEWVPESHADPRLFDEIILRNQVSCRSLVYVFNLWKGNVLEVLDCLNSLDRIDLNKCEGVVRFCFDYFGVRLPENLSVNTMLLNPDAAWVGSFADKRFIVRNRKVSTLDARHFASAAQKYWRQELVSAGYRVLWTLEALYKGKPLSKYNQSVCLTGIYDVARFLNESNSLDMKKADGRKLHHFLNLSAQYFDIVFPLDSRHSLLENLISMRQTEISKELLGENIFRSISTYNELTYRQIGRVMMIMLGSGKPKNDLYMRVLDKFGGNSSWKPFIENLNGFVESDSIHEIHTALEESFISRWSAKECISPNCFFYLVERLLIMIPHPQGYFFAAKSSFVEHLICLESDDADPSSSFFNDEKFYSGGIFKSFVQVVMQCLYEDRATAGWIKRSCIDCYYYFPVLMQRLVVILCLLCLNSGDFSFNALYQTLDAPHIWSQLPGDFCEALLRRRNNGFSYVAVIAGAFKIYGDPLVIVSTSGNRPKVVGPDSIFLDMRSFSCRNEVMKVLFPWNIESSHYQQTSVDSRNVMKSGSIELPHVDGNRAVASDTMESKTKNDINLSSENGEGNMGIKWGLIRETYVALESLKERNDDEKLKSLVLKKKVEVEEHVIFLSSAMSRFSDEQERSHSGEEDKNDQPSHLTGVIEELKKISSLLNTNDVDFKSVPMIGELLINFEARRPQVDALLSQLTLQNESNAVVSVVYEEMNENKVSGSSLFIEDDKTEDLAAPAPGGDGENLSKKQGAECSQAQGKGKGKQKKKSRKGRGRGK